MGSRLMDSLAAGGPVVFAADVVVKATVLLCLAAVAAAAMRRSSAAARHRLWGLTLCGLLALPSASWLLPGRRLPILPATVGNQVAAAPARVLDAAPPDGADSTRLDHDRTPPPDHADGVPVASSTPLPTVQPLSVSGATALMAIIWALGIVAAAAPALAGAVVNARRRRRSRPLDDPGWTELFDELAGRLAIGRRVELRIGDDPLVPMTWGFRRPVVLLPDRAIEWPEPMRRIVLLHELAHVKRLDVAWQWIGRAAASAYWFHPLAWHALRRLRAECEHACDDRVVDLGAKPGDYAGRLVELARSLRPSGAIAAVPLTRGSELERRVKALFDERRSHRPLGRGASRGLLVVGAVVLTGFAAIRLAPAAAGGRTPTAPAVAGQAEKQAPAPAISKGPRPEVHTHPVTIAGRALDPAGKPIAGARVYLASLAGYYGRTAETTTNAEGRYEFREVKLPIERANTVEGSDRGVFQVFGEADGMAFAWRPAKSFYPVARPADLVEKRPDHGDWPWHYYSDDPIVLDLRFTPATRLAGTIIDEHGKPRPGVRVEIRGCESLRSTDNVIPGWNLDSVFNDRDTAPPSMKLRATDAEGRFEFTGLPADCRVDIEVSAKGLPGGRFLAATPAGPRPDPDGAWLSKPDFDGQAVLAGDVRYVVKSTVAVPIKMVFADTGEPAAKVAVQVSRVLETSDDRGLAVLRIPPGTYRMENWPAVGTPYLPTEAKLVVGPNPPAEPFVAALRPAGIIDVEVVDAETGAGIPDVDVWEQPDDPTKRPRERLVFRSWDVAPPNAGYRGTARRDSPRTDADGKLRALVEPGKHRIGVGLEAYPPDHEVVEADGLMVDCPPGEPIRLKFTMRKRR